MNKKVLYSTITILLLIIFGMSLIFFNKNMSKNFQNGNNMSSQEIVNYILNISSYEAEIAVDIYSNKNTNKYIIKQKYISPNINEQEVLEPSNIAGVKIIKEDNNLKIENSNLSLSKIFENYNYIADNCLDLSSFITDYQKSDSVGVEEKNDQVIIMTQSSNDNKYAKYKILYIDKETIKPTKMEIKDNNENTLINIIYKEIKIN